MSSVQTVVSFIEANIPLVVTGCRPSPHYYDVTDNDSKKIDNSYSIRPLDASPISGTVSHATYTQDFEIEITRNYSDSRSGDTKLREVIELIYIDQQKISKQLSLRRVAPILLVGVPSKGAPVVDDKNKFVSITFNYPIQYKEFIKEV